jgi:hypothetical protein
MLQIKAYMTFMACRNNVFVFICMYLYVIVCFCMFLYVFVYQNLNRATGCFGPNVRRPGSIGLSWTRTALSCVPASFRTGPYGVVRVGNVPVQARWPGWKGPCWSVSSTPSKAVQCILMFCVTDVSGILEVWRRFVCMYVCMYVCSRGTRRNGVRNGVGTVGMCSRYGWFPQISSRGG